MFASFFGIVVVLLDDGSNDDWRDANAELLSQLDVVYLEANCGTPARSRNAILDYVDDHLPSVRWVARLDADDRFCTPGSLAAAVEIGDRLSSAFVLGGNRLIADGQLLERVNVATPQLLNSKVVLNRLKEMAEGTADNELPSCNLLLRRGLGHRYPDVRSAEDHWLVARLLLQHSSAGAILQDVLYSDYTLTGKVTSDCLSKQLHSAA